MALSLLYVCGGNFSCSLQNLQSKSYIAATITMFDLYEAIFQIFTDQNGQKPSTDCVMGCSVYVVVFWTPKALEVALQPLQLIEIQNFLRLSQDMLLFKII